MLEFAEFQQEAKQLSNRLRPYYKKNTGCMTFFNAIIPNNPALEDALMIGELASSLDYDYGLKDYICGIAKQSSMKESEFLAFKTKVLSGIYLLKWCQYNTTMTHRINNPLIELFKLDLQKESLSQFTKEYFLASLDALSCYCSHVFKYRSLDIYARLNHQLGEAIQVDIHTIRNSKFEHDSSLYTLYTGIIGKFESYKIF